MLLPFIWIGPIQAIVALCLLWPVLGPSSLGAIGALTLLIPIQFWLNKKFGIFRRQIAGSTDERARILSETISSLKLIKLYAWESPFHKKLLDSRKRETDAIYRASILRGVVRGFSKASSKLLLFFIIVIHCLVFGNTLDASALFMSMTMLNNVQFLLAELLPSVIGLTCESLVSLGRMTDFLLLDEFEPSDELTLLPTEKNILADKFQKTLEIHEGLGDRDLSGIKSRSRLSIKHMGANWGDTEAKALEDITLDCESPDLVLICGQLASGKSSLFMALLNELTINEGKASVRGSLGYASQVPWIFNATVRDNIVFGQPFDKLRYKKVVEACALSRDFQLLACGDMTYIQQESLSGGQKARVNLARCLYRDCDIYLLDDPFSAIDGQVAQHIFREAILMFLANKLVLLTTHKMEFLNRADKILLLDHGRQVAFSSYEQLALDLYKARDDKTAPGELIPMRSENLKFLDKAFENHPVFKQVRGSKSLECGGNDRDENIGGQRSDSGEHGENLKENSGESAIGSRGVKGETEAPPIASGECNSGHAPAPAMCDAGGCRRQVPPQQQRATAECEVARANLEPRDNVHDCTQNENGKQMSLWPTGARGTQSGHKSTLADADATYAPETPQIAILPKRDQDVPSADWRLRSSDANWCDRCGGGKQTTGTCEKITAHRQPDRQPQTNAQIGGALIKHVSALVSKTNASLTTVPVDNAPHKGDAHQAAISDTTAPGFYSNTVAANTQMATDSKGCPKCNLSFFDYQIEKSKASAASDQEKSYKDTNLTLASNKFSCDEQKLQEKPNLDSDNNQSDDVKRNEPPREDMSSDKSAGWSTWCKYYTQTSVTRLVLVIVALLTVQAVDSFVDIYLTVWTQVEQNRASLISISDTNQQWMTVIRHQAHAHHEYDFGAQNEKYIHNLDANIDKKIPTFTYDAKDDAAEIGNQQKHSQPLLALRSQIDEDYHPHEKERGQAMYDEIREEPWTRLIYEGTLAHETQRTITMKSPLSSRDSVIDSLNHVNGSSDFQISGDDSNSQTVADDGIMHESMLALSVRPIYRPLYLAIGDLPTNQIVLGYVMLLACFFTIAISAFIALFIMSSKTSISIYKGLISSALYAQQAFFDQIPLGRFLNRATRDVGVMDEEIPNSSHQAYDTILKTIATFVVVSATELTLLPLSVLVLAIFSVYHWIHITAAKSVRRYEGIARTPIINHVSTTLEGIHTIRVTNSEARFEESFIKHQDSHSAIFLLHLGCTRILAIILDGLNAIYVAIIAFVAILSGMSGPTAGLLISSTILLAGITQHGIMKLAETETLMTSVERIIEYCNLPQEENRRKMLRGKRKSSASSGSMAMWPSDGRIEYRDVNLYYNRLDKPVLKDLNFNICPGEKVGIIGRTGAGKSSIIITLFRLYDFDGSVLIDGVDTKSLDLLKLRSSIGIIPQTPILFSGTLRENLDPLEAYDDFTLWNALERANMRETIRKLPGQLNYDIGRGGISSGQKQLICLARVLLRRNRILVMDEATANVDPTTDAIIQRTIRQEFSHCTVLTIAHRLETILDSDRIMVLDGGRIIDFDTPERLASRSNSFFAKMLIKSNESE